MKKLLLVIPILSVRLAVAQTHIWTQVEASEAKFHVDLLPVTYEEVGSDDLLELIENSLGQVISKDVNPGIHLITQVLVSAQGKVDYVIFDLQAEGFNKDSISLLVKESFEKNISVWKPAGKIVKPFRTSAFTFFGKRIVKREVRQTDSSVVDIEKALVFVDSLKVKRIFFNQLGLKSVPEVIYRFPNAEELYLNANELTSANFDLRRLPKLRQLFLDGNLLTDKSLRLSKNKRLQLLNIKDNRFKNVPGASRKCRNLSSLWLGGNRLTGLSSRSFRKLKNLKDLNFYRCDIVVLPKGVKKLKTLEVLDLYYNKLSELPNSLTTLKNLRQLAVSYNELKVLPENIDKLQNVNTLYAHHNKLSKLPENFARMKNIALLDLGYNWFYEFPKQVVGLDSLHEFDISGNNLPEFPAALLQLKTLDKLYLRGNPFIGADAEKKYASQIGILTAKNVEVFY